ncbi:MAG: ATP--guanido phosphotransferase [Clostridia bacterium]|nr:ATP--guanido phosphotransferase [Clostridia bacterium]
MMNGNTVLSSRVRLARNFEDLPFDTADHPDHATMCIARTANALKLSGADRGFEFFRLQDMTQDRMQAMKEHHLISKDLMAHTDAAAVLIDFKNTLAIMMNEEDHLRIQAVTEGMSLRKAADRVFMVEDALSRQVNFAFDSQLGYLTACPTNTGTGMRASLLMHLPMLTRCKQMGDVGQIVAKVGLNIRGVYGEGSEALGNLYQVSNQVTLGRTEQENIATVEAVAQQLTEMENALREKTLLEHPAELEDTIYRAWGTMKYARLMPLPEFFRVWSDVRLGAAMGLVHVQPRLLDTLLEDMQDACLRDDAEAYLTGAALNEERAKRIRAILGE